MLLTSLVLAALIQDPGGARSEARLPPVVVSATARGPTQEHSDPGTSLVTGEDLRRASVRIDVVDALRGVPGLQVRDRHNYAQDLQIGVRGFGARASFGVRGVRLYVNGIPASAADGQGQLAHALLDHATSIEVLRGPYAALYGNAAGGVIHLIVDPAAAPTGPATSVALSADLRRYGASFNAASGSGAWSVAAAHFDYDGFRPHSAARRDAIDAVARGAWGGDWNWSATFNALDLPLAQDPLGLTRADFERDPDATTAVALAFDTRKRVRQQQTGFGIGRVGSDTEVEISVHAGRRAVEQFLAIPPSAQANPRHPGGVIDLQRDHAGLDARLCRVLDGAAGELRATLGLSAQTLDEQRRGYANFVDANLGVRGTLRRDERNRVRALDSYARLDWRYADNWNATLGLRSSRLSVKSEDRFVNGLNPDDSGTRRFSDLGPLLGLSWQARSDLRWHAAYAEGFETPTLNELAYRTDGGAGLSASLDPARNRQAELGLTWQASAESRLQANVFRADSENEIVVASNTGGRASFRNAGRARRQGVELGADIMLSPRDTARLSWTWIDARFSDAFAVCTSTPCTVANALVDAGNRLPGVADQHAYLEWRHRLDSGWNAGISAEYVGDVAVDDLNRDAAPAYTTVDLFATRTFIFNATEVEVFLRLANAGDRRYAGSVIVNEGNARYFEPAPGRQLLLGLEIAWH